MIYESEIIRVILIEEQKVIREGLKILLESESDIKIVASFSNSQDALVEIEELKPNIVLVSVALSTVDVFDVIKEIQRKLNQVKVIVFCNEVDATNFVQYLELGVKGCLLKEVSARKIREIVRYIDKGYTHIEDNIFKTVVPQLSDAISALTIADAEFKDTLNSQPSEVIVNDQLQLSTLDYDSNSQAGTTSPQFYLPIPDNLGSQDSVKASVTKKWWQQGVFKVALASLGMVAIAIGVISYRQEAAIVIQDGVINGKLVAIASPVEGQLQEILYLEGMNLEANQLFAFIEPVENRQTSQLIDQLEKDINLKQEQIENAQKFLSFLERQLKVLPQKREIALNISQAESETTISIDNSREIINLEQQIFNQKSTNGFLRKELNNLQEQLKNTKANLANNQIISLEAPISGVIYNINYREGELIPTGAEIATLLDCQNLWAEAIVDSKVAAKINLQKEVSIQLEDRESLILGQVNRIESLSDRYPTTTGKSVALTSTKPINNQIPANFSRVIINVDFPNSELMQQDLCDIGLNVQISFNN